jgi:hypothetical protein
MRDLAPIMDAAQRRSWGLVALDCSDNATTATFAQFGRRLIRQTTREALAKKKAQGIRLGRPRQLDDDVVARIVRERKQGLGLTAIANSLNEDDVPTAQGGACWYPSTVRAVLAYTDK